jgi:hypothetical protein
MRKGGRRNWGVGAETELRTVIALDGSVTELDLPEVGGVSGSCVESPGMRRRAIWSVPPEGLVSLSFMHLGVPMIL